MDFLKRSFNHMNLMDLLIKSFGVLGKSDLAWSPLSKVGFYRKVGFQRKFVFTSLWNRRDVILRLNLVLEMSLETWANSQVWYTVCSSEVVWPLVHKRAHRQWIFSQATSTLFQLWLGAENYLGHMALVWAHGVPASEWDNAPLSSESYIMFFLLSMGPYSYRN